MGARISFYSYKNMSGTDDDFQDDDSPYEVDSGSDFEEPLPLKKKVKPNILNEADCVHLLTMIPLWHYKGKSCIAQNHKNTKNT